MKALDAAWEAVCAAPTDVEARVILADALLERGDALGEFIRLQLSHTEADQDAALAWIADHVDTILDGALWILERRPIFRRGLLESVSGLTSAEEVRTVLGLPVARVVSSLSLSAGFTGSAERLVPALRVTPPRGLRRLVLSDIETPSSAVFAASLSIRELLTPIPELRELHVGDWSTDWSGVVAPSMRGLELNLKPPVLNLREAQLGALEQLTLTLPFRRLELPETLLQGRLAPVLRTLKLTGALWPEQLSALIASPLLKKVKHLELLAETDTGWYPLLLWHSAAFEKLERLVVRRDRHHPSWVETLQVALPRATLV